MNFYLLGRLELLEYAEPAPNDIEVLNERITNAVNSTPVAEILIVEFQTKI